MEIMHKEWVNLAEEALAIAIIHESIARSHLLLLVRLCTLAIIFMLVMLWCFVPIVIFIFFLGFLLVARPFFHRIS